MATNSSISLTSLDFDTYKDDLKTFLKSQDVFKDYDFDGSNMSVLLDLLAKNTYTNGFYLNMIGSEMFLDSAQLRDTIISHCKDLNYIPRSFSSSMAIVDIIVNSTDSTKSSLFIPRGTRFSTKVGDASYIFTNADNITLSGSLSFLATDVVLYEGNIVQETYTSGQRIIVNNARADISSMVVTVIEDNGSNIYEYTRATSLFDLDSSSKVFFIQGFYDSKYEVVFGDGKSGRMPKDNSIINIEYRVSSGELPNGANKFTNISSIDNETDVTINTKTAASGGSVSETNEEIKFNAPRHYSAQERSVTEEDYASLLKINFPEINAVIAYGGENKDPPQYGKVFVVVDLKDIDILPDPKKELFYEFLKRRSPVTIEPIFETADVIYLTVSSNINYNINKTALNQSDIRSLVIASVLDYSTKNLDDFGKSVRYSKLIEAIDDSDSSIISNETDLKIYKSINAKDLLKEVHILFGTSVSRIESSFFKFKGQQCQIRNNGNIVSIYYADTSIQEIGTVNLLTGQIDLSPVTIDELSTVLKVYANSDNLDITIPSNSVIKVLASDIDINVVRVSE